MARGRCVGGGGGSGGGREVVRPLDPPPRVRACRYIGLRTCLCIYRHVVCVCVCGGGGGGRSHAGLVRGCVYQSCKCLSAGGMPSGIIHVIRLLPRRDGGGFRHPPPPPQPPEYSTDGGGGGCLCVGLTRACMAVVYMCVSPFLKFFQFKV